MGFRFVGSQREVEDRMHMLEVRVQILLWILLAPKVVEWVYRAVCRAVRALRRREGEVAKAKAVEEFLRAREAQRAGMREVS